jgi:hypothetical protein
MGATIAENALGLILLVGFLVCALLVQWSLRRIAPGVLRALVTLPDFQRRLRISIISNLAIGVGLVIAGVAVTLLVKGLVGPALGGFGLFYIAGTLVVRSGVIRAAKTVTPPTS